MADNYINPKVKSLYDALKSDGGDVGTEQEFNSWMFKPGEEGYKNRMKVYAAFKEDGADIGKDYGEFSRWLGLHAVKPQSAKTTTSPRVAVAKPAKAKTVPNEQGVDASPLPQGFGTLDKRHGFQAVAAKADEIDKREDGGDSLDEAVAKIENPDPTKPMSGKALERAQSYMQHRKDAADYRAETGKDMPAIFAPSQGKKTPDIAVMEAERDENGNITGRTSVTSDEGARRADYNLEKEREEIAQRETLDEKKRHREELREALDKKRAAIDAEMDNLFKDDNVLGQMGRPTAKFGDFSPYYQADTEYVKLKAAIRKADSEIQMLEDAKSGNTNNFFHGMGNTATDGYSFRMGLGEINDATAILSAAQDADAINRKLDAGEELTESEKNSLAVLRRFSEHDTTAGKYGNQYGMWHKGGETATGSMDYMIDFILAGGIPGRVAKGVANGVVKAGAKTLAKDAVDNAAKAAVKAASRGILKATGIAAGSTAAGALISNTTGMPRTIGSLATELAPTTFHYANDKGEMRYGAEQKVDDADDIMHAIYNAETSSIGENASEMTGLFFPGSKAMVAGIGKLGFRNTANSLIHMGTRPWAKKYAKFLERAGWNGIPGEALEEYVGVGYDALFKHDGSAMEQLKDPEFHRDVLFGTAAISVMLGVPGLMAHGGGMAQFYRYKHKLNQSATTAAYRFGNDERWNSIKERIDATPNEQLAHVVTEIADDKTLAPQQRQAVDAYALNLARMRAYNIGQMVNRETRNYNHGAEDSYARGYNEQDPDARMRAEVLLDTSKRVLTDAGFNPDTENVSEAITQMIKNGKSADDVQPYIDYLNAKTTYDGMMQRHADDVEDRVANATADVDLNTNSGDDMMHRVNLQETNAEGVNRKAFVTEGNVVLDSDGNIDKKNSSQTLVVRDAETGEAKIVSPSDLAAYDTEIDPAEAKRNTEDAIRALMESQPELKQLNLEQTLQGDGNGISLQKNQEEDGEQETVNGNNDVGRRADGSGVYSQLERGITTIADGSVVRMYGEEMASLANQHRTDSERNRRRATSERLVEVGKSKGNFLSGEETKQLGERKKNNTGESVVYINKKDGKVYKVKDPYSKSAMKGGVQPEDAVFEHLVHNILFPETRYTLEGISDDAGDVRLVLSQGYVKSADRATRKQIEKALAERGLHKESEYTYGNDYVSVTDVDGDNVLVGVDGKIYFIDPIINFKKPINEVLAANAGLAVNGASQNQTQNAPENFVIDGAPDEYTEGMRLTVRDEGTGEEKPAEVVGRVRYKGGKFVPDENGNIIEYVVDGEVRHTHTNTLNLMVVNHTYLMGEIGESPEANPQVVEGNGNATQATETTSKTEQPGIVPQKIADVGETDQDLRDIVSAMESGDPQRLEVYLVSHPDGKYREVARQAHAVLGGKDAVEYNMSEDQLAANVDAFLNEARGKLAQETDETAAKRTEGISAMVDPRQMSASEKNKRGDMLRNATAVDVAEGQIVASQGKSARKAAEEWWDANFSEPLFYNTEIGEVEINRNSVESSLAHRYGQAKLDAITSLADGFENAVYLGSMPDFIRQEGVTNHYFVYPINYKGQRHYVFCRAMEDANKNRLYVHEVFMAEGLKKGNTLQTAASQPHGGIALYRDILANVLDVQSAEDKKSSIGKDTESSVSEQADGVNNAQTAVDDAMPMRGEGENAEPDFTKTTPARGRKFIYEEAGLSTEEGDAFVSNNLAEAEKALAKVQPSAPKIGTSIAKFNKEKAAYNAKLNAAQNAVDYWKAVQTEQENETRRINDQQRQARLQAEEEKAKLVALEGAPEWEEDRPQDARARGFRRSLGERYERQGEVPASQGKEVEVKFADQVKQSGNVAVMEVSDLQPSHFRGQRNPMHFLDEAQPKERKGLDSTLAAENIARHINPEEITSSVTAYTGAPSVNRRGETIQGNNRSAALKEMWEQFPEQAAIYKQYLIDHAEEFGLDPEVISQMEKPVLVNMLDVNDTRAIELGQYTATDTESGGVERIKPQNAVQKMGEDMGIFAGRLLRSTDEEATFAQLLDENGVDVLKWMQLHNYITPTQYKSAFDTKGNLTAEAKNDLKGIMYHSIFQGGSTQLEEMFNRMPAKAQKAILATAYRDFDSPESERAIREIQNSIVAYNALMGEGAFEEAIADAQPLSVEDMKAATDAAHSQATKETTQEKPTEDKPSLEQQKQEQPKEEQSQQEQLKEEQPKEEKKSKSKYVNDEDAERFEELRARLRQKLRGQMNMGVDPEIFAIGVEMSYLMLKKGARKINEFTKNLIDALGEEVRPYVKAFYNGARELPEMADYEKEMTPYEEVRRFDVKNFDKEGAADIFDKAKHVAREQEAEREAKEAEEKLKAQRNERRKEKEQQAAEDLQELVDFHKHADSTGRTSPLKDAFIAEGLILPLSLDGKASRLAVETFVPDDILLPSHGIATYSYADEIDERTNTGWQKWGDLLDKYNSQAEKDDKGHPYGDAAAIQFRTVDAAVKFADWVKPYEKNTKEKTEPRKEARGEGTAPLQSSPSESKDGKTSLSMQAPSEKIDDYGEKIAGARKDMLRDYAKTLENANVESFVALPFAKAFKRPNLKKLVEAGALREKDARFAEAVLASHLSQGKPRLLTRSRYAGIESTVDIRNWAERCAEGADMLRTLLGMDEAERDKFIEDVRQRKAYDEEAVNKRKIQLVRWNPGQTFEGTCYGINPVVLFMDVYSQLGYDGIGDVKLPVVSVNPDSTFSSYELTAANGKGFYSSRPLQSYEDVVDEIVYQTKRRNGDSDNDHPTSVFRVIHSDPIKEVNDYYVSTFPSLRSTSPTIKYFNTKEEADAYANAYMEAHEKGSAFVEEHLRVVGYKKFTIAYVCHEGVANEKTEHFDTTMMYATKVEARAAIVERHDELNDFANAKDAEVFTKSGEGRQKKDYVYIHSYTSDGGKTWTYAIVLDDKYNPHKSVWNTIPYALADGFKTRKEAEKYLEEHRAEWDEKIADIDRQRRAFVYFDGDAKARVGEDYRNGEDVTAEQFATQFGFRGVQFGNWTNQNDRQAAINNAFDGFMDLAKLLGVSPRALSLNGELGIAFGARGTGKNSAHYELQEVVINLTKTNGAGSLAHEWWHALDNYFARQGGVALGMVTNSKGITMRDELRKAFNTLIDHTANSDYDKRSAEQGKSYWGTRHEETARMFETWVNNELLRRGERNHFLVGKDPNAENDIAEINYFFYKWSLENSSHEPISFEEFKKTPMALSGYVYPTRAELETFGKDLRRIFDTVQERVDEETGNVVMYHRGNVVTNTTPQEQVLLNAVVGQARKAGIEVVTDVEEGQRVLDMANGEDDLRMDASHREKSEAARKREEANRTTDRAMAFVTGKTEQEARAERHRREDARRKEAKEIYDAVLQKDFNSATLQQINDYIDHATPQNPYGRRISQRVPQRMERGLHAGERTNAIDALFSRICESAVAPNGRTRAEGRREIERKKEECLESWARATGNWHESVADFTHKTEPIASGTDSDVYFSDDGKTVIKVSKGKFDNRNLPSDIDQVNLFNHVFPNNSYRILGYGRNADGQFVRYLEQHFVDFSKAQPLTTEERTAYMNKLGFKPLNKKNTAFSNGEIVVAYLKKSNIVKSADGNIRVIDADVKLHTKDNGGTYTYPAVEEDTRQRFGGVREQRVYHGSGADFDHFDLSHMGTGEGMQVHGYGIYVIASEDAARGYAVNVARVHGEETRHLYSVEIPDGPYLEEGKPMASDKQQELAALLERRLVEQEGYNENDARMEVSDYGLNGNGKDVYGTVVRFVGSDKAASELFSNLGYKGIMFSENNETNYVLFNENDAKIVDHVRFFRTANGEAYGFTTGGRIYIDPSIATAETPIHEYTHLWNTMLQATSPKEWKQLVGSIKDTPIWNEVKKLYPELQTDDEIADEAFSHYGGREGAEELRKLQAEIANGGGTIFEKAGKISAIEKFKDALKKYWNMLVEKIGEWFGTDKFSGLKASRLDGFKNTMMRDLANGLNPTTIATDQSGRVRKQFIGDPRETFKERQKKAVEKKGVVMPGLNDADLLREGAGEVSDDELSYTNDPWAKMLGKKSYRSPRQRAAFAARERRRMVDTARKIAEGLHLDNVEIVEDASTLSGRQAKAKGFYDKATGKITIVIPNHMNVGDVVKTMVHESIAHYGLRNLFGERFDTFLDNVYEAASKEIRGQIVALSKKHGWNVRTATEEYLASLAERTDFVENEIPTWWHKIKQFFLQMLNDIGLSDFVEKAKRFGFELTDNELRYFLWKSYDKLNNRGETIVSQARDIAMQSELGVGEFAPKAEKTIADVAAEGNLFSYFNGSLSELIAKAKQSTQGLIKMVVAPISSRLKNDLQERGVIIDDTYKHTIDNDAIRHTLKHHGSESERKRGQLPITEDDFGRIPEIVRDYDTIKFDEGNGVPDSIIYTKAYSDGTVLYVEEKRNGRKELAAVTMWKKSTLTGANRTAATPIPDLSELSEGKGTLNVSDLQAEDDILFRDGDPEEHERGMARASYEHMVRTGWYQVQEAMQDSMLGVEKGMSAILRSRGEWPKGMHIEDVPVFENPYLGENALSSVNQDEANQYNKHYMRPLLDEVKALAKTADERAELTDYMMAKHGLERNDVMARRAAEKKARDEFKDELRKAQKAVDKDPGDSDAIAALDDVKQRMHDRTEELYFDNRGKDYAGLTALTQTDNVVDAEAEARRMVQAYETAHDTQPLWQAVNDATKATLEKTYKSGMMSKETFDEISGMYQNYIPLRGFDEKTAEDAYAYLNHRDSVVNAPIKTAKGRKSKADDPFANIASMAETAIMQGNRNTMVKQRALNFALNHPSDLISVSDLWLHYDKVSDEWVPVFPDNIEDADTPDEVEKKMKDFETKMQGLQKQYPDEYKSGHDTVGIPYRVVERHDKQQHQVIVRRAGRDYVLTVNGNPRMAQALNGQTNPDNDLSGAVGKIIGLAESVNRGLASVYTTRNPNFLVSNFIRDEFYGNGLVWVKESPAYAARFNVNAIIYNPATMKWLLAKDRNGTLDTQRSTMQRYYNEFMRNGGETGFTNLRDIDAHKKEILAELKRGGFKAAWKALGIRLDELNRGVENAVRFTTYVTSREMGRSVGRSIWDAKEISVNFNKKGAGNKFMGTTGQTKAGDVAAFTSGLGRSLYVFWNAAVQGSFGNFFKVVKRHPGKSAAGAVAAPFVLGLIIGMIGLNDDDDKNKYANLPKSTRRQNICFKLGGQYITIPLPTEIRAIYGMGELAASVMLSPDPIDGIDIAKEMTEQVSQILPLDFMEGGGFHAFVPSGVKPLVETAANESWTGVPIYNDSEYQKNLPEWRKAYKNANAQILAATKWLNEATGGDDATKGEVDVNPAKIEYLLNGYFSGYWRFADQLVKSAESVFSDRDFDWRNVPLANRVVKSADERVEYKNLNTIFYRYKDEADKVQTQEREYKKVIKDQSAGVEKHAEYLKKLTDLVRSEDYVRAKVFEKFGYAVSKLNAAYKQTHDEDIPERIYAIKKACVDYCRGDIDLNDYLRGKRR